MIETYNIGKPGGPTLIIDDCSLEVNLRRLQWLPLGICFWVAAFLDELIAVWPSSHTHFDKGLQKVQTCLSVSYRYSKSRSGGGLPWGVARNRAVNAMLAKEREKYEGALAWQRLIDKFAAAEMGWLEFVKQIEELEASVEAGRAALQAAKEEA